MKRLIVGGIAQGKRAHAEKTCRKPLLDGGSCDFSALGIAEGVDRLHLLVKRMLQAGLDPESAVMDAICDRESWLFVCDEVGSGIVPLDPFEREWRERTGRLCCALALRADRVERVVCGLVTVLKGEEP